MARLLETSRGDYIAVSLDVALGNTPEAAAGIFFVNKFANGTRSLQFSRRAAVCRPGWDHSQRILCVGRRKFAIRRRHGKLVRILAKEGINTCQEMTRVPKPKTNDDPRWVRLTGIAGQSQISE
jgi:hypothetical protein